MSIWWPALCSPSPISFSIALHSLVRHINSWVLNLNSITLSVQSVSLKKQWCFVCHHLLSIKNYYLFTKLLSKLRKVMRLFFLAKHLIHRISLPEVKKKYRKKRDRLKKKHGISMNKGMALWPVVYYM